LGISRSGFYYQPRGESALNLLLMRLIDQEYTAHPFLGSRKMVRFLRERGIPDQQETRGPTDAGDGLAGDGARPQY
jgi:hypothetical protein